MFGKFENIEAFLDSYSYEQERLRMERTSSLSIEDQIATLQNLQATDIAEVKATINQREADDKATPKHYQMIIVLDEIIQSSADIQKDILQCKQEKLPVFVAIRFGDSLGLTQPITTGMNKGDKMHFKGQWITRDKAYSHGGKKMSVLHFTHHPIGFTRTIQKCYT